MGTIIELRGSPASLHELAEVLLDVLAPHPEILNRLKVSAQDGSHQAGHGTAEHINFVVLDYRDLTPKNFETILPFLEIIFELATKLIDADIHICVREITHTGEITSEYLGSS